MSWTAIASIELTQDWQSTPVIASELGLIRVSFSSAGIPVEIAQIDLATGDMSDKRRVGATGYAQIFEFRCPSIWSERAIAVRLPLAASPFEVTIELSDLPIASDSGNGAIDIQPILSAIDNLNPTATIDPATLQPLQDELQSISGGQSLQLSKLGQLQAQQLQLSQQIDAIDLDPIALGQSQILQQISAIDLDIDPQIGVNVQAIKDGQTGQNTALSAIASAQTTQSDSLTQIQARLNDVLANKTSLDYYGYANIFAPSHIFPLNDPGNAALNPSGVTIGSYGGSYLNNQANLISRLPNTRSTRFNGGGITTNSLTSVGTVSTLICRFRAIATASGGIFSVSNGSNLQDGSSLDRECYLQSDGKIAYRISNVGNAATLTTPLSYRDDVVRTLVVRTNGNVSAIFIDGQKIIETNLGFAPNSFNNNGYWRVGLVRFSLGGFANGITIQGAIIIPSALSDAQIAAIQTFV